jgi:YD repeat-containing protein
MPFLSPQPPPLAECAYPTSPITGTQVISYTYDPLYRLTDAAYSGGECFRYQYDKVGNRTVMTSTAGVATYQYDAANRLTNAGGQAYTWNNNGSLTHNGKFTFTYNAVGRMTQAQGVTTTLTYAYNGDGLLVSRNSMRYVWDLAASLPQMLSDGNTLYIPGVAQFDGAAWMYQLPDGLGSVRQLVDAQRYVVQRYDYGPFGETLTVEGKRANTLRYRGVVACPARHRRLVGLSHLGVSACQIDLGGVDRGVPHQFRQRGHRQLVFDQLPGESVAQLVAGHRHTGFGGVVPQPFLQAIDSHGLPVSVGAQRGVWCGGTLR